jgi:hypothetical protein
MPRSIKSVLQFLGVTEKCRFASIYRRYTTNRELSRAEKHQECSAALGFHRKASRTFSSSWAVRTPIVGKDAVD